MPSDTSREPSTTTWLGRDELAAAAANLVTPTDTVLDIGCGLRPQNFFRPAVHFCCEPHAEYVERLEVAFGDEPGFIVAQGVASELLPRLPDASFDSVFMMDVIEHLTKEDGQDLIRHAERLACKQIVLFTPWGFLPQRYEDNDVDGWGMRGGHWQAHRSGWTPDDFPEGWRFLACRDFHSINGKGEPLATAHGAFWAIKDIPEADNHRPPVMVVAASAPPEPTAHAQALKAVFSDGYVQRVTLLSTRDSSARAVVDRCGAILAEADNAVALRRRAVLIKPRERAFGLPKQVARRAPALLQPCVRQAIAEARSAGARAVFTTPEGKTELLAAAAAARWLGLPLVIAVQAGDRGPTRRLRPASSYSRALMQADLVWSPGDAATANRIAAGAQPRTDTNSVGEVLAMIGINDGPEGSIDPRRQREAA